MSYSEVCWKWYTFSVSEWCTILNNLAFLLCFVFSMSQSQGASLTQNKVCWRRKERASSLPKFAFSTLKIAYDNLLRSFMLHSYLSIGPWLIREGWIKPLQKLLVSLNLGWLAIWAEIHWAPFAVSSYPVPDKVAGDGLVDNWDTNWFSPNTI